MKKITTIFAILALVLTSCEGEDGRDGLDGFNAARASTFEEVANFTYNAEDNFWSSQELTYTITDPDNTGPVFLVYLFQDNNTFTPLPASFFDDEGEFQYVFDHDSSSVVLSIIGDSDLSGLDAISTQNVRVRVAIVPGDLIAQFNENDLATFQSLMHALKVNDVKIENLSK